MLTLTLSWMCGGTTCITTLSPAEVTSKRYLEQTNALCHVLFVARNDVDPFWPLLLTSHALFGQGVSHEGASFAAHEGLDNLIIVYDSNDVTLDKMAEYTQSEDTAARYEAYGWEVVTIDGHDLAAVKENLDKFRASKNGKPKLLVCKTIIGKGIDEVAGTNAAHGEAGVKYVAEAKAKLGLKEPWEVSSATRDFFKGVTQSKEEKYNKWQESYKAWQGANADKAKTLQSFIDKKVPSAAEMFAGIPEFDQSKNIATREAGSVVINPVSDLVPQVRKHAHPSCELMNL